MSCRMHAYLTIPHTVLDITVTYLHNKATTHWKHTPSNLYLLLKFWIRGIIYAKALPFLDDVNENKGFETILFISECGRRDTTLSIALLRFASVFSIDCKISSLRTNCVRAFTNWKLVKSFVVNVSLFALKLSSS